MQKLSEYRKTAHNKLLLWGAPKGAGKSTLSMYALTPGLVLQYDIGNPVVPPGVDPAQWFVKVYPAADAGIVYNTDRWQRAANVGEAIIKDLTAIRAAYNANATELLLDGISMPLPASIVMDGLSSMASHILDWILAVNKVTDPDDFKNTYKAWSKRLQTLSTLYNSILPLPCNVLMTTWEQPVMRDIVNSKGDRESIKTAGVEPNIGGALDNLTPGKVDASLYCYSEATPTGVKYMVRTRPSALVKACGVRDGYKLADTVDVTIKPGSQNPYRRIFD